MLERLRSRRRDSTSLAGLIVPIALIIVAVLIVPSLASGATMFLYELVLIQILMATSTNFLFGRSHMPSLGQAAFFGTGAYTVALVYEVMPIPAALLLAIAVAVVAFVIAAVSVRTDGLVFANVTLALGQGMYLLAVKTKWVGSENGIPGISAGSLSNDGVWYLVGGCVIAALVICWVIYHSPFGLTLYAIREDPIRLEFLGVNVAIYRMLAFTLAVAGAGLAGGLFAYASGIVTPNTMYWTQSGYPILMILVGGMGFFWGPAIGAIGVTLLINELSGNPGWNLIILGLVLIGILLFAPRGLLGLWEDVRARLRRSPTRRPMPAHSP